MAATIRNTPRNSALYGAGSVLQRIKQALNRPTTLSPEEKRVFGSKLNISLGDLLMGQAPEALQDWSYEGSRGPISGRNIQTLKIDPRVLDVAGLAAVGAPVAAKAAKAAAPTAAKHAVSLMEKYGVSPEMYVIKPEGGQWLSDENSGIERLLRNLRELPYDDDLARAAGATEEDIARAQPRKQQVEAHNKWLDTTLKKYIKQRMATPSDEIRKLADQGITHITKEALDERAPHIARLTNTIKDRADYAGIPYEQVATTKAGQTWENLADYGVYPNKVEDLTASAEPWMSKLDPKDIVHHLAVQRADEYGFDHMMDVLRQDLETGRIRPENINKLSVEQMVRRTHEYDKEMAKRMEEQALQEQAGLPLVKEYPEGYRWLELKPKDLPEGHAVEYDDVTKDWYVTDETGAAVGPGASSKQEALNKFFSPQLSKILEYEGNKMGHCVGGYCDDVTEGKSQIFSLRDKKGEPHVTIEVQPSRTDPIAHAYRDLDPETMASIREAAQAKDPRGEPWGPQGAFVSSEEADFRRNLMREATLERFPEWADLKPPMIIKQIKGKQNRAPKEDYLPFVQDFVRSGNWDKVHDLGNTGLIDLEEAGVPQIMWGGKRFATPEEYSQMVNENAKAAYAKGGAVEEESITQRIPRAVRKLQYKAADVVGLGPEIEYATEIPERYFPANEQHLGRGDAMRHLLLQAQLQRKFGDLGAYLIGAGHELFSGGQTDAEAEQDKLNDILGRKIGRESKDLADATYKAYQAVNAGKAKVLTDKQKQENGYAEGGLVYDDSHIDKLAEQLLG